MGSAVPGVTYKPGGRAVSTTSWTSFNVSPIRRQFSLGASSLDECAEKKEYNIYYEF